MTRILIAAAAAALVLASCATPQTPTVDYDFSGEATQANWTAGNVAYLTLNGARPGWTREGRAPEQPGAAQKARLHEPVEADMSQGGIVGCRRMPEPQRGGGDEEGQAHARRRPRRTGQRQQRRRHGDEAADARAPSPVHSKSLTALYFPNALSPQAARTHARDVRTGRSR